MRARLLLELPRDQWTLTNAVRAQAERYGAKEFLGFEGGKKLSFRDLHEQGAAVAEGFRRLGVVPGDRVLVLARNGPELLLSLLGANLRGATFVPINTELKGAFLEHQAQNSEPRVIVVDDELLSAFEGVNVDLPGIETVLAVGQRSAKVPDAFAKKRVLDFRTVEGTPPAPDTLVAPSPQDVSTIMYTSGTTGPSKGVLMPHAHCYLMGRNAAVALGMTEADTYFVCMPMFHANALLMQTFGSLAAGARVRVARRFSASSWLDDVRASGATLTNGLGVMPEFIYRQPPTPRDREHKLRAMMAVPIGADWGEDFEKRFGVSLVQGYGMTEINIVAYGKPGDPIEPGCAGDVLDEWFEVRIVDPETDREVPKGHVGEIVVRPREPFAFNQGYFRMPEKTVEAWRNLWFHSGDAGKIDARGKLFFVDRIKDCIRRRGENISSFEVEQVINSHEAVAESAVYAVKDPGAGGEDEVKAALVLRPGANLDPVALLDYCQPRMPRFAVPRFVEVIDALPKTSTGKIQKTDLRKAGVTPATWDRESIGYKLKR